MLRIGSVTSSKMASKKLHAHDRALLEHVIAYDGAAQIGEAAISDNEVGEKRLFAAPDLRVRGHSASLSPLPRGRRRPARP